MRRSDFWLAYFLLLCIQLLLSNYANFTPYVTVSLLPVMVLCIPGRMSTVSAMIIAFASGLAVDFLAEGVIGLNAFALVAVAFSRKTIIRLIFGEDLFARKEDFNVHRHGFERVALALVMSLSLFFILYIWIDGAGTRPLWFSAARFAASLATSFLLSLLSLSALAPDPKSRR